MCMGNQPGAKRAGLFRCQTPGSAGNGARPYELVYQRNKEVTSCLKTPFRCLLAAVRTD
jgi:hypothetical protein